MAVMKYKENGEWVAMPAAVVNTVEAVGGNFKYSFVNRITDKTGYDLSPYVAPGADFMIMFTAAASASDTQSPIYVWIKSDGIVRKQDGRTTHASNSYYNYIFNWFTETTNSTQDDTIEVVYDEETCVFNIIGIGESVGQIALLFHA